MKRLIVAIVCLVSLALFAVPSDAMADGNPAAGAGIFRANCNSCHLNGRNNLMPNKSLKEADLIKWGKNSQEAIVKQVTYGKPPMPAFKGRLKPQQIEDVAAYVLQQSKIWK